MNNVGQKGNPWKLTHLCDPRGLPYDLGDENRVVNIRDLRDYFVSLVHHCNRMVMVGYQQGHARPSFKCLKSYSWWMSLNHDEKLLALITLDRRVPYYTSAIKNSIARADEEIALSREFPEKVLITRFENWIGEKGGGSKDAFFTEMKKVLSFFGAQFGDVELQKVYELYYGVGFTFDRGKMGRWREEFKQNHIDEFKKRWNEYLIRWGYESDAHWEL